MTVPVLAPPASEVDLTPPYASWGRRVVAALLDSAVLGAVAWFAVGDVRSAPSLQPTIGFPPPAEDVASWTSSAVLVAALLTMLLLQGLTGQTPGRRVVGIAVVRATDDGLPTDAPAGVLRSVGRWLAHLLDAILLIGYLRPLWHHERRTFADSLLGTVVVRRPAWRPSPTDPDPARSRRRSALVTVGATVLVVVGVMAGVSYGQAGGVERLAETQCPVSPQDASAPVTVDRAALALDREWSQDLNLWPRTDGEKEDGRRFVAVDVTWVLREGLEVEPGTQLLVRTTSENGTIEHSTDLTAGGLNSTIERAGTGDVDVEIVLDDEVLATCSARVPTAPAA